MTTAELQKALNKHAKWLRGEDGGERANFQGAYLRGADFLGEDLRGADFRGAYLRGADFRGANFRGTDLRGADLDHSAWPLWCGSRDVRVDARIARQLAAHFCALDCDDDEYRAARLAVLAFAQKSHRAKDLGLSASEEVES